MILERAKIKISLVKLYSFDYNVTIRILKIMEQATEVTLPFKKSNFQIETYQYLEKLSKEPPSMAYIIVFGWKITVW